MQSGTQVMGVVRVPRTASCLAPFVILLQHSPSSAL